jgi:UDP-GlcNAc:undecaprenyl-phosphate GlcNAc-1-phosphate transferase
VIVERIRKKKSIFEPDMNHLHHKLLELGWSQAKIAAYFYAVTAAIAIVALNTRIIGKAVTLVLIGLILLVFLAIVSRKIGLKKNLSAGTGKTI